MNLRRLSTSLVPAVLLLAFWEFFVSGSSRRLFLFGSPSAVLRVAFDEIRDGAIGWDFAVTAITASIGLIVGGLCGTLTGLALWLHPSIARISKPYIAGVAAIPIFALAPMLIVWFGIGMLPRVIMAGFPVVLLSLVATYDIAAQNHARHEEWMSGLCMTRAQRIRWVLIPEVVSVVTRVLRNSVGLAIVGTFIGEFVVSERGLGRYILRAGSLYDVPKVLFGILLIVLLSLLVTGALDCLSLLQRSFRRARPPE